MNTRDTYSPKTRSPIFSRSKAFRIAVAFYVGGFAAQSLDAAQADPAKDYPAKPVRFVVPMLPGGGNDIMARIIAQKLTEAWTQPVVVENRPGGSTAVAGVFVARSPADGYTLLINSSTLAIAPNLQSDLPYNPVRDFAPVALVATGPTVLTVHPSVPANSIKELVALAKARPGSLNYASSGSGTLGHMAGELFKMVTKTDIVHIAYKGSGSGALADLVGGYVQLMFSGPGAVIVHVRSRKLKALAVASPGGRAMGLEDVPTFDEAGYREVKASNWFGVLTTVGTPKPVVDKLNREIVRIIQLPEVKERFLASGYNAASSTPQEFAHLIKDDLARWQRVVKASGVRVD